MVPKKPLKRKPKVVAVGQICSCCLYGNRSGPYVCGECKGFEAMLSDLERRERVHHEESKAIRDWFAEVLDTRKHPDVG